MNECRWPKNQAALLVPEWQYLSQWVSLKTLSNNTETFKRPNSYITQDLEGWSDDILEKEACDN